MWYSSTGSLSRKHFDQGFEYSDLWTLHWLLLILNWLSTDFYWPLSTLLDLYWLVLTSTTLFWLYWSSWNYHQLINKVIPREGGASKIFLQLWLSTADSFREPQKIHPLFFMDNHLYSKLVIFKICSLLVNIWSATYHTLAEPSTRINSMSQQFWAQNINI